MVDRLKMYFSEPYSKGEGIDIEVIKNTTLMVVHFPEGFNYDGLELKIIPLKDLVILPVSPFDGRDLEEDELRDAFVGEYLGLYMPHRQEGDQFIIEITEGSKGLGKDVYRLLVKYEMNNWKNIPFLEPIIIK